MLLTNDGIKIICTHTSPVINIFHFTNNDPNHFISLSDNGEIVEWLFNKDTSEYSEIERCLLQRPSDDILLEKKHQIKKLKAGEKYYKITKAIQFEDYICVGYIDGVILVFKYIKKEKEKFTEKPKESITKENNELNLEEEREENEEEENKEEENEIEKIKINPEEFPDNGLNYFNVYSLYYILLGHNQSISYLYYMNSTKMLATSCDEFCLRIFEINTGHLLYYFKLDFPIKKILGIEQKNVKSLVAISSDPFKFEINFDKDPISFNYYSFSHNTISQIIKLGKFFYLLGPKNIYYYTENLEYKGTYVAKEQYQFNYLSLYKDSFIIFDKDNILRFNEIMKETEQKNGGKEAKSKKDNKKEKQKPKNNKDKEPEVKETTFQKLFRTQFKMDIGCDNVNDCYNLNNFLFFANNNNNVYVVDIESKIDLRYERELMSLADEESFQYMNYLKNSKHKGKKQKKAGKSKGKNKKK